MPKHLQCSNQYSKSFEFYRIVGSKNDAKQTKKHKNSASSRRATRRFFFLVEEGCGYVTGIDVLSVSLLPVDPPPVEREREREKGKFGNLICCPPLKRYTLLDWRGRDLPSPQQIKASENAAQAKTLPWAMAEASLHIPLEIPNAPNGLCIT